MKSKGFMRLSPQYMGMHAAILWKHTTNRISGKPVSMRFLYRITSRLPKKASCAGFISSTSIRRTSWCGCCAAKSLMWRSICAGALRLMENGTACCFRQKTKSSFLCQRTLHTDFWCCLIMRNSHTNARIFTIRKAKAAFYITTRKSEFNGRCRKAWS